MKFSNPPKRDRGEMILPMVNVVFLLLIFLMLMGKITEGPTLEITPTESREGDEAIQSIRIFVDASGQAQFQSVLGRGAVLNAVEDHLMQSRDPLPITIRADQKADFAETLKFAEAFKKLPHGGITLEVMNK